MSPVPSENIALHIIRHLVRGLGKSEGQGISIQSLRHWWTVSLGSRSDNFKLASNMPPTAVGSSIVLITPLC
jgi:hypothetical protein